MKAAIKGVKIRGLCAAIPKQVYYFKDEIKDFPFPEKSSLRLGQVMGFKEHRISDDKTSHCDLASFTLNHVFRNGFLKKDQIQSLVVVSQGRDHPVPGNSKVIHGQLKLPRDAYCMDIFENCIGYISGLYAAACQINSGMDEVILITTDIGACRANKLDRHTYPLSGDAASVTIVSRSDNPEDEIKFVFHNDGSRREVLYTPAGGSRMPYSEETAKMVKDELGNYRSLNMMHMNGTEVFQFVMQEVPLLIKEACEYAGIKIEDIEYHLCHQPNKFMLEKLADHLGVPREILFNNIVEYFGNSSPSTIPLNISYNLGSRRLTDKPLVGLSAFGAGLSLAAAITRLGEFDFCEVIEHPGNGAIE